MKRFLFLFCLILHCSLVFSQGRNSNWLICHHASPTSVEGRLYFTSNSISVYAEQRVIPFQDTQGNISDENGNLLMSSNGIFIANSTGDTMMNGGGLNPGQCRDNYSTHGFVYGNANIIIPYPGNANYYILFHQVCEYPNILPSKLYYSIIDQTLDNGKGAVISKNNIFNNNYGFGLSATKHANGRDWWVIALSGDGTEAHKYLISPQQIQYYGSQNMPLIPYPYFASQPNFSPDGSKFAFTSYEGTGPYYATLNLFQFDRCNGTFQLDTTFLYGSGVYGYGSTFSANGKYLYFSTIDKIWQMDTDTSDIGSTLQIVAVNDTFLSAPPVFYTNFYLMYRAANGKIYLTSTNSVLQLHVINSPDSAGLACDVSLHSVQLPCFNTGSVPNHPNYYLGAVAGSVCDSLGVGLQELQAHDFRFSVSPNPSSGNFRMVYLLPQNQSGILEVFDVNGRRLYAMQLPPWSTMQEVALPSELAGGVYSCVLTSGGQRAVKKVVLLR